MPNVDPLNETELLWIANNLKVVRTLAVAYEIDTATLPPETLDRIYAAFRADPLDHVERDDVVNAIGIAFGQYLVDTLGMQWVTYSGDDGGEIGVHGDPGDLIVLPTTLVEARYQSRETGFLDPLFRQIAHQRAELRRNPPPKKPWWKVW